MSIMKCLFALFIISETREPVTVNWLSFGWERQSSPSHLVLCPALGMVCVAASNGIFSAKPRPVLANTNWSLRMTLQRAVAAFLWGAFLSLPTMLVPFGPWSLCVLFHEMLRKPTKPAFPCSTCVGAGENGQEAASSSLCRGRWLGPSPRSALGCFILTVSGTWASISRGFGIPRSHWMRNCPIDLCCFFCEHSVCYWFCR